jgi:hypothetical protein
VNDLEKRLDDLSELIGQSKDVLGERSAAQLALLTDILRNLVGLTRRVHALETERERYEAELQCRS